MGSGRLAFGRRRGDLPIVRELAQQVLDLEARRLSRKTRKSSRKSRLLCTDIHETWLVLADALEEQGGERSRLRAFWARELATGRDEDDWYKKFSVALGEQNVQGPSIRDPHVPRPCVQIIPEWRLRSREQYEELCTRF